MNVVTLLGILAAFALLIPSVIIFLFRLSCRYSLCTLAIYFLVTGLYNLMAVDIIHISGAARQLSGVTVNYLDVPMMLIALLFFCTNDKQKNTLYITLGVFVLYELIIGLRYGFNDAALYYILGPGLLIVFVFAILFFVRYARISIEKNKQVGKTLMLSSVTFAYGCYGMIYFFDYIQKTPARADVFLIYYIASIVASVIMSIGLMSISRRSVRIKEAQVTRRELALFFNH